MTGGRPDDHRARSKFGFFVFNQARVRPLTYPRTNALREPSSSIQHARRKTAAPSPMIAALSWIPSRSALLLRDSRSLVAPVDGLPSKPRGPTGNSTQVEAWSGQRRSGMVTHLAPARRGGAWGKRSKEPAGSTSNLAGSADGWSRAPSRPRSHSSRADARAASESSPGG